MIYYIQHSEKVCFCSLHPTLYQPLDIYLDYQKDKNIGHPSACRAVSQRRFVLICGLVIWDKFKNVSIVKADWMSEIYKPNNMYGVDIYLVQFFSVDIYIFI